MFAISFIVRVAISRVLPMKILDNVLKRAEMVQYLREIGIEVCRQ